jgi:DNA-binding response OmpR family regulator
MDILIADDDRPLVTFLSVLLEDAGYKVLTAYDGQGVLHAITQQQPDLVLLDVTLPQIDGLTLCRRIRRSSDVPIIFLSARSQVDDRVAGLNSGADDYVVKPFEPTELLVRISAVLRRAVPAALQDLPAISRQGLTLMPLTRTIVAHDQTIMLTPIEFRLLHYLMTNSGQVLRPDQIIEHIWGATDKDHHSLLTTYVSRLRAKLEPDTVHSRYIITVHGVGYAFGAES